ncbi:MAG: hypothetical protein QOD59_605 [Mycobacterium sp.]|jgi:hypothetical protein|nr:hypothetical protein [Mycobacterium sp.]
MTTSPHVQSDLDFGEGFDFTDPGLLARGLPVEQFARCGRPHRCGGTRKIRTGVGDSAMADFG